ncbi:MAG: G8 domain-containing protein [Acidobacteriota bacterium]
MRKHYLLFLSLLVPAFLVLGGYSVVKAQQGSSSTAVKGGRWSDAATWADKKVPGKDAVVTIEKDMNVVLDVSPPELHGLTINGKLSFADNKDLELTTEWIMLHGELEIGTEAKPHTRNAAITLTNNVPGEDVQAMGDRGIMLMGGTLNLHGNRKDSWTKLVKTAAAETTGTGPKPILQSLLYELIDHPLHHFVRICRAFGDRAGVDSLLVRTLHVTNQSDVLNWSEPTLKKIQELIEQNRTA